ncbi:hypothetical protein [Portibacter lacus]|uniref:DUF306 domain-containing protein n=1 Tax=Portibacter lacus TaxID=1099794 RepID=A0AA37SWN9_9BACT|nr:hypothetical protein [Portibacter lacus]GLR20136.1 hypothetical protein GCM10007940_47520 [Portibacter lacus]
MKNLLIFITLVFLCSCSKDELSEQIIGRWKFKEIKVDSTSNVLRASDPYFITFTDEYGIFHTDHNSCGFTYNAGNDGAFEHDFPTCTLVGGRETDFSDALPKAFGNKKIAYFISGKKLTILGDGYIELRRAPDE